MYNILRFYYKIIILINKNFYGKFKIIKFR